MNTSLFETVGLFHSTKAEFFKGLRGIDYDSGQACHLGLHNIAIKEAGKHSHQPHCMDTNLVVLPNAHIRQIIRLRQQAQEQGRSRNPRQHTSARGNATREILHIIRRAGAQGAKLGMVLGGIISLVTYAVLAKSGNPKLTNIACRIATDAAKGGGIGYATAFSKKLITHLLQASLNPRPLTASCVTLPTQAITAALSLSHLSDRYAMGDMTEAELFRNALNSLAEWPFSGSERYSLSTPAQGTLVGCLIGYALANLFYQSYLNALAIRNEHEKGYERIRLGCYATLKVAHSYRVELEFILHTQVHAYIQDTVPLLHLLTHADTSDKKQFSEAINRFAAILGQRLQGNSSSEADESVGLQKRGFN